MPNESEKKILLVEDNADDELLTLRVFKKNNIKNEVVVARDGAEALEVLLGSATKPPMNPLPTIILLDLKLPKVDGLEVLRLIRTNEKVKTIPIVVLTSSKEEQDVIESYKLGANSYVRKPVEFTEFSDAVSRLGIYWLLLNEPPPRQISER